MITTAKLQGEGLNLPKDEKASGVDPRFWSTKKCRLCLGDCLDVLKLLPANSIDACVTDPPYGLSKEPKVSDVMRAWIREEVFTHKSKGFMGKDWDAFVPGPEYWREVFRVLKPGAHLLVFAGTRTWDLMSIALRFAGFENRDTIANYKDTGGPPALGWTYGQGFPKGSDVSKMIDKMSGAKRKIVGPNRRQHVMGIRPKDDTIQVCGIGQTDNRWDTEPATPAAQQWSGYGSALKPAWEVILVFRKPFSGTLAKNVIRNGTGALNIDRCRIAISAMDAEAMQRVNSPGSGRNYGRTARQTEDGKWDGPIGTGEMDTTKGRWPSNLILSHSEGCKMVDDSWECTPDCPICLLNEMSGIKKSGMTKLGQKRLMSSNPNKHTYGKWEPDTVRNATYRDSGYVSRFFYCSKTSKSDRNEGLEGLAFEKVIGHNRFDKCAVCGGYILQNKTRPSACQCENPKREHNKVKGNFHPTVKPTDLLRYLCRLIGHPNCVILDPFMGSGSTGKASVLEGFRFVGIEKEDDYCKIALARIKFAEDKC